MSGGRASGGKSVCVTNAVEVAHCVLQPKVRDLPAMTFTNLSGPECRNVPLICNVVVFIVLWVLFFPGKEVMLHQLLQAT